MGSMCPRRRTSVITRCALPQRISPDQHAAVGIVGQPGEQPVDLAAGLGMVEDGQAERRLGDEDVAWGPGRKGSQVGSARRL
jgi:hypothetical protein